MRENQKKTIIIHILRILHNYTSFSYPVTQTQIVNYLHDINISCCRKTVGRNLRYLIECGVPICRKQSKKGGYYYDFSNDNFFKKLEIKTKE